MTKAFDYDTAERLDGTVGADLVDASEAAEPTGAVPAYRDADGCWRYVQPSLADAYRTRGEDVITVYVQ